MSTREETVERLTSVDEARVHLLTTVEMFGDRVLPDRLAGVAKAIDAYRTAILDEQREAVDGLVRAAQRVHDYEAEHYSPHYPYETGDGSLPMCSECDSRWPCPYDDLASALKAVRDTRGPGAEPPA